MKPNRGFSLVELLVVIVIIAIVAIIAIPNLITARRSANEGSAISALRTLHGADMSYAASVGDGSYAGTADTVGISSLIDLAAARLIDQQLGTGDKSGYDFIGDRIAANVGEPETFYFAANPSTFTGLLMTGTKRFGVATDGVIRSDSAPADLGIPFDEISLALADPINNQ